MCIYKNMHVIINTHEHTYMYSYVYNVLLQLITYERKHTYNKYKYNMQNKCSEVLTKPSCCKCTVGHQLVMQNIWQPDNQLVVSGEMFISHGKLFDRVSLLWVARTPTQKIS